MGYINWFAGCPMIWSSNLQTTVTLSTTKPEYITLLAGLQHDAIYAMQLLNALLSLGIAIPKYSRTMWVQLT
jgi:hypothetical protein